MDIRTENELRQRIVEIGRLMHQKNFIAAGDGNITVRLDRDRLLVTPSGLSKGFMDPEQLIVVDLNGAKVSAGFGKARDLNPSSEIRLHLECYRQRADVNAVIHAHPPQAIACTIAGISLAKCILPEVVYDLGSIPTAPYATPTSAEGPLAVRELIRQYDALMLDRHGSVTVGKDLWEAYMRLERIEHSAQVTLAAQQALGGKSPQPLPNEAIEKLAALRRNVFAARGRDVCAECNACPASERHAFRSHAASSSETNPLETLIAEEVRRALK